MVIVKIIGGLGNQLFQYAAARRISYLHDMPLKLDISGFLQYKLRKYSLMHFNIIEEIATKCEINRYKPNKYLAKLPLKIMKKSETYVQERDFNFDPEILAINKGVYLDGYWQSENYFKDIEAVIRKELSIKTPIDDDNCAIRDKIDNDHSISIHIRRGDYVSNSSTTMIYGICSLDYYRRAVAIMAGRVKSPHFFIFSDDPSWARDNLKLPFPATFIVNNGPDKDYEDLRLMSLCRHNILANSSFSWWGAWLNAHPDKMVIAPQKWFNTDKMDPRDLVPQRWIKI